MRESEIFREPPGSGNYTSSIGAAVGIELFQARGRAQRARPSKTIVEPKREVPVLAETDILVVGGGPARTAAAIAAARLRADVLLVERYNHLGGLSTGGLVIWIDRMTDWSGRYSGRMYDVAGLRTRHLTGEDVAVVFVIGRNVSERRFGYPKILSKHIARNVIEQIRDQKGLVFGKVSVIENQEELAAFIKALDRMRND